MSSAGLTRVDECNRNIFNTCATTGARAAQVIPCFGVHPWWAHLHAAPNPSSNQPTALSSGSSQAPLQPPILSLVDLPAGDADPVEALGELYAVQPSITWEESLRHYLALHPHAIVGEFGLDRAAYIPGTKRVQTKFEHQLELTRRHLLLAAELGKPVSMHCVRAFGHLQDMCRHLPPEQLPPRIMLHRWAGRNAQDDLKGGGSWAACGGGHCCEPCACSATGRAEGEQRASRGQAEGCVVLPAHAWPCCLARCQVQLAPVERLNASCPLLLRQLQLRHLRLCLHLTCMQPDASLSRACPPS